MKSASALKGLGKGDEYSTPKGGPSELSQAARQDEAIVSTRWEEKIRGKRIIEEFLENIFTQNEFKNLLEEGINAYASHLTQQLNQLKQQNLLPIIPAEKLADLDGSLEALNVLRLMVQGLGENTTIFDAYAKHDRKGMWVVYFTAANKYDLDRPAGLVYDNEGTQPIPTVSISVKVDPILREELVTNLSYRKTPEEIAIEAREEYANIRILLRYAVPGRGASNTLLQEVKFIKGPGIDIKLYESGRVEINGIRSSKNEKGRISLSTTENPVSAQDCKISSELAQRIITKARKLLPERKR